MADTTTEATSEPADADVESGDERLAHRGPIQTLLTRPEIGALLGATGVWLLFWLVSAPFGTVGGTANFLDVAAVIGLMAVPVALLMIGGEFDLSSGSMTGATAIIVILLSSDTGTLGGAGLSLHLAVPLSLAFALAIGWFNGTLVEKTSLPSFIVTLGTFFILIGGKLGFAKLFTNKVIVEGLDEAQAYEFWHNIFGAQWVRNGHIWDGRDWAWAGLLILGGVALLLGVLELTYARRSTSNPAGVVVSLVGVAAGVAGLLILLMGSGSSSDWIGGLAVGVGVLVGVAGWCMARYESAVRAAPKTGSLFTQYLGAGVIAVVVSMIIAAAMDAGDAGQLGFLPGAGGRAVFALGVAATGVFAVLAVLGRLGGGYAGISAAITILPAVSFMMTVQAARAVIFGALAVTGLVLLTLAANRARLPVAVSALTSLMIVVLAFFIQSQADSRKLRVELFSALLIGALALAASALARHLSARRTVAPPLPQFNMWWTRVGAGLGILAAIVFAVVELAAGKGILYCLAAGVAVGGLVAFGVYAVGTAYHLLFTRDAGVGRSVVTVGLVCVLLGVASKLLFITGAEAAATRAETRFGVGVLFFLIFAVVGAYMLVKTQFGSWIFAVGGNKDAARSVGVPAARTKTTLFMMVSGAAWLTGMTIAFRLNSVQANVGDGNEFRYIIVAVVGGNLLTGGYGSALGAAIGALIWGMIQQGIGFSGWNSDWRFLVLGALLLVAVMVNNYVRGRAEKAR